MVKSVNVTAVWADNDDSKKGKGREVKGENLHPSHVWPPPAFQPQLPV